MSIKQKSIPVVVENNPTIDVRRMSWGALIEFTNKTAKLVRLIYKDAPPGAELAAQIMKELPEVIRSSGELTTFLAAKSTGKTSDEINDLDCLVASEVVNTALALNTDDELKNSLAGIVGKLVALMPAASKTTPKFGEASTPT